MYDFCRHSLGEAGVLQRVAVCCSMLQSLSRELCATFADIPLEIGEAGMLQRVAVCCSALQCVAACCSVNPERYV